jgi:serine/threonine-protein kinase
MAWKREWQIVDEIDRGGQGIISKLVHKDKPEKLAVLKQIVPRWEKDPQARERLQHEGDALSKLGEHRSRVPCLYDSFVNHKGSAPFLVIEYIKGLRFDRWLKDHAPVSPKKAAKITLAITETIQLCHKHEIGHRDLKPTNIILKNGETSEPYVLDFGISFDSYQTHCLTRNGEMFWNEFIILPECQDLEGGHRDLRSDITALVGIFYSCITGRPPIVLRNAQELSPHRRDEGKILEIAENDTQGEQLLWFFDKGFEYRISQRFQSINEFKKELEKFKLSSINEDLDLMEQFKFFDQTVTEKDRKVQLSLLKNKHGQIHGKIHSSINKVTAELQKLNGILQSPTMAIEKLRAEDRPPLEVGDELTPGHVINYTVSRQFVKFTAHVLLVAFGVGMQIHFYSTSCVLIDVNFHQNTKQLVWEKIAVIEEDMESLTQQKKDVIINYIKQKLAVGIKNITRQNNKV